LMCPCMSRAWSMSLRVVSAGNMRSASICGVGDVRTRTPLSWLLLGMATRRRHVRREMGARSSRHAAPCRRCMAQACIRPGHSKAADARANRTRGYSCRNSSSSLMPAVPPSAHTSSSPFDSMIASKAAPRARHLDEFHAPAGELLMLRWRSGRRHHTAHLSSLHRRAEIVAPPSPVVLILPSGGRT
jgi:hypothetical protein